MQFLGVALDNPRNIKRFIAEHAMNYPTLQQDAVELAKVYGNKLESLPYTVITGRDGVVLQAHPGALDRDQAILLIQKALPDN